MVAKFRANTMKLQSLKRILSWVKFNRRTKGIVKNNIFEIPFNKEKVIEIKIPNIQNKTFKISKWFVKVGDFIKENQIICELESNSIALEYDSILSGKVVKISTLKTKLKADDLICMIEII